MKYYACILQANRFVALLFLPCVLFAGGPTWDQHYEEAYQRIYTTITKITPSIQIIGDGNEYGLEEKNLHNLLTRLLFERNVAIAPDEQDSSARLEILLFLKNDAVFVGVALTDTAHLVASHLPVPAVVWKKHELIDGLSSGINGIVYSKIKLFTDEILDNYFAYRGNTEALLRVSLAKEAELIREARLDQDTHIDYGDLEDAASIWTDDFTFRHGLGASVIGKEANLKLLEADLNKKNLIYVHESDVIEVSPQLPLAFESGKWTARQGSEKGQIIMSGKYSAQWVKQNGDWLIRSEVSVALTCNDDSSALQVLP